MALITLKEWAEARGVKLNTARKRILSGRLSAGKRGRDWWIDEDAEFFDLRLAENKEFEESLKLDP